MTAQAAQTSRPLSLPTRRSFTRRDSLPRYQLLSELGRGGMGIVYKARDRRLGRLVALKLLPPEWSQDEVARKRFVYEAQAASAIDHPNICTIHDIEATRNGQLFLVMAYYEGETLKDRLKLEPIGTAALLDITAQIAASLAAAHACGIVHRDIKPGNIFLCCSGVVKVLDFGLARRFSIAGDPDTAADGLDTPGRPFGTANYMAPERILDMPADPRNDIFSLGVVMYEMATGRRPFTGASPAETVLNVLETDPEPIASYGPAHPAQLDGIVRKALAKDLADRIQSAGALRLALDRVTPSESEPETVPHTWRRAS